MNPLPPLLKRACAQGIKGEFYQGANFVSRLGIHSSVDSIGLNVLMGTNSLLIRFAPLVYSLSLRSDFTLFNQFSQPILKVFALNRHL